MKKIFSPRLLFGVMLLLVLIFLLARPITGVTSVLAATSGSWSTYQNERNHSGFNGNETIITPSSVSNLHEHWHFTTGGPISTQPIEVNGKVFYGSWDGNEYATDLNGNRLWSQYLGQTNDTHCNPTEAGVASTATIETITLNGTKTSVLFVGGGNANFYALNAETGAILWHTPLGTSPSPDTFLWSSPNYYQGSVYMGVSSFGDCPLVQGQVVQLNAATGSIEHVFDTVPNGCAGAGVWGSPTLDIAGGVLYFGTGNAGSCSQSGAYGDTVIELRLTDLSLVNSWTIPLSQQGHDSDFGSTVVLFKATINGTATTLVGILNKNGFFYALLRSNIGSGPVWEVQVGSGGDCPQCGTGNISPPVWNGYHLFIGSGNTTIKGTSCNGSVRAVNPANGQFIWQNCFTNGHVLAAISGVPGVIFVPVGQTLQAIATTNGSILKTLSDNNSGSLYYGAASISGGIVYIGNMDGLLHAYGT